MSAATTLGAVVALFDGDATLAGDFAASGGLWVGGVPETNTELPVCVLNPHDEIPTDFYPNCRVEQGTLNLVVYGVGLAATEALASDIKAVFDPKNPRQSPSQNPGQLILLDIAGTTRAWIKRTGYRVRAVEYRASDSSWVYEITMPFETVVEWQV